MITIHARNAADAWAFAMLELFDRGTPAPLNKFFRNDCAAIEIEGIHERLYHDQFPMTPAEIGSISEHLLNGVGDPSHDWTGLYRERLFDGEANYIDKIIHLLRDWPDCPRAQVSVWNNAVDHARSSIAPCLQMLWFKILDNSLHLHVHMRTSDCYGKLLMNFNEFIVLQKYVAHELALESGAYVHFIDSMHFHEVDERAATVACERLRNSTSLM